MHPPAGEEALQLFISKRIWEVLTVSIKVRIAIYLYFLVRESLGWVPGRRDHGDEVPRRYVPQLCCAVHVGHSRGQTAVGNHPSKPFPHLAMLSPRQSFFDFTQQPPDFISIQKKANPVATEKELLGGKGANPPENDASKRLSGIFDANTSSIPIKMKLSMPQCILTRRHAFLKETGIWYLKIWYLKRCKYFCVKQDSGLWTKLVIFRRFVSALKN